MAADARLLALETLVLGRAARGETVATGAISDQWRIRRGGRLVHAEALRLDGDLAAATARGGDARRRRGRWRRWSPSAPDVERRVGAARALAAARRR